MIGQGRVLTAFFSVPLLVLSPSCKKKQRRPVDPWADELPRSRTSNPVPGIRDAEITIRRKGLFVEETRLLKLTDARFQRKMLRDGPGGLFITALSPLLRSRSRNPGFQGRLAVRVQPAAPFGSLRAVLYTAMRAKFTRPWIVVSRGGKKRGAIPIGLPSAAGPGSHGLRATPPRPPPLRVGLTARGVYLARWGKPICPGSGGGGIETPCFAAKKGRLGKKLLGRVRAHLWQHFQRFDPARMSPRGRQNHHAFLFWAGLEVPVGEVVKLLDALATPRGSSGCRLAADATATRWRRESPLAAPGKPQGCLYYQAVISWARPGG